MIRKLLHEPLVHFLVLGAALFNFLFYGTDELMARLQANVDWIGAILSPAEAALIKYVLLGVALMLLMVFRPQGLLGRPAGLT